MSAPHPYSERPLPSGRSEETAERAFLLWVALYALLVIMLVSYHAMDHGLPLLDGFGHRAMMAPVGGL